MKHDVFSIYESQTTVKSQGAAIDSLKRAEIQRHGVRRFESGRVFQASRLGAATKDRLLADTIEWGGPGVAHEHGFAPAHSEKRAGPRIDTKAVLAEYTECAHELSSRYPNFVFSGSCAIESKTTRLTSDYGLDLETSGDSCSWYFLYQRKGTGNMMDGWVAGAGATPSIRRDLDDHVEYLKAQTREIILSSGRLPVVLVDGNPLAKLIESFEVNRYEEGSCLFAGKLGETLFSKKVTLVDRAYDPRFGRHQFFDGEGIVRPNDELRLVDQGKFAGLISDLRFGRKYGRPSTGNGVRTYKSGVGLGLRSLHFAKGDRPWREILKGLDRCIVSVISAGGDSNGLGEFSTPIQVAYVFEKGELVGRAPQITVKTSVADYLGKDLVAISSDGFTPSDDQNPLVIAEMDVMVN